MVQAWKSKTLWVNVIAAVSMLLGAQLGAPLTAEQSGLALVAINLILRAITKEPLEWS